MLSILLCCLLNTCSCRGSEPNIASPNLISPKQKQKESIRAKLRFVPSSTVSGSYVTNVLFCLLLASLGLQCLEGSKGHLRFESKEGEPCICNNTFFKACPAPGECVENKPINKPRRASYDFDSDSGSDFDEDEDEDDLGHPDHNDELWKSIGLGSARKLYDDDRSFSGSPFSSSTSDIRLGVDEAVDYEPSMIKSAPSLTGDSVGSGLSLDRENQIVRHRKVYLRGRQKDADAIIHPIKISIPVKLPDPVEASIPEPKSVYRMQKFTTYETKPEIQMVPVTKTIIRPVGVSPDQIIGDTKDKNGFSSTINSSSSSLLPKLVEIRK